MSSLDPAVSEPRDLDALANDLAETTMINRDEARDVLRAILGAAREGDPHQVAQNDRFRRQLGHRLQQARHRRME